MKPNQLIIFSTLLLSFFTHSAWAKKAIFSNTYNSGVDTFCENQLPEKTLKKACKSGNYPGKKIYQCKFQCPTYQKCSGKNPSEKKWITTKKTRICNSDGKRKGYYINSCAGDRLDVKTFKKACAKKEAKGKRVVLCKDGEVKKSETCPSAKNNDSEKFETRVFVNKCGGEVATKNGREIKRNLSKACRTGKFDGKSLVKCKNKCTSRSGFKCSQRTWIEQKKVICSASKKAAKIKSCDEEQTKKISGSYNLGKEKMEQLINQMNSWLDDSDNQISLYADEEYDKKAKKKIVKQVKKALKKAKKIKKQLGKKPIFYCKGLSGTCAKDDVHAFVRGTGKKVNFCDSFFSKEKEKRASYLVHELSHHAGTKDFTYDISSIKNVKWWKNASTFDNWTNFNGKVHFCVPGFKNCF